MLTQIQSHMRLIVFLRNSINKITCLTSVVTWSTSNLSIVFCNEDRIPRLKFNTHDNSPAWGHSSSISPSWNENLLRNKNKQIMYLRLISAIFNQTSWSFPGAPRQKWLNSPLPSSLCNARLPRWWIPWGMFFAAIEGVWLILTDIIRIICLYLHVAFTRRDEAHGDFTLDPQSWGIFVSPVEKCCHVGRVFVQIFSLHRILKFVVCYKKVRHERAFIYFLSQRRMTMCQQIRSSFCYVISYNL